MTKLETFFDSFFPILGVIFVIILGLVIIGSFGYTHDRYNLSNIDIVPLTTILLYPARVSILSLL